LPIKKQSSFVSLVLPPGECYSRRKIERRSVDSLWNKGKRLVIDGWLKPTLSTQGTAASIARPGF